MKKVLNILAIGLIAVGVVCLCFALKEQEPYRKSKEEQHILQNIVVSNEEGAKAPSERKIDFHALKQINEDIVAWIYIPGTNIDYPVLIGENDAEYLNKNYKGEKSPLGAIFAFADTARDFTDSHICIFGHNMRTAQMFGELKRYKERTFAESHQKLYCYTPLGVKEYKLFDVYECEKTDEIFEHKGSQTAGGQTITLACCSDYNRTVNRMTVHFVEADSFAQKIRR